MAHQAKPDLPWKPRFIWGTAGSEVDWRLRLPMLPWDHEDITVGGSRTAAGGIPAAYVVRRDENLLLTLRVYETELTYLFGMVGWGQASESIRFYPDQNSSTYYTVYLETPKAGESWRPTRTQFPKVLEVSISLRKTNYANWDDLDYFPCVDS